MPIPPLKHHIVFVSDQTLPTVLGISLPGKEPSHIHAIVTPTMREACSLLQRALETQGRTCAFSKYELKDNANQHAIHRVLESIRETCDGESLGVNLTGGTKLMALAASQWASTFGVPAFYIDTAGEVVIQLAKNWQYANLPDVLTVRGLLAANGFFVEKSDASPVPSSRRDVLTRLMAFACSDNGEKALGHLNWLAGKAAEANLCVRNEGPVNAAWDELLTISNDAGTLLIGAGHVAFPDEESRRWCNGVWFEEYVKMTLYRLKAEHYIRDFASSVKVRRKGVLNELDALFTVRNRLFTIECKTAAMIGSSKEQADRVTSFLYKADSLHDRLGGVFAKAMIFSVFPLAAKHMERARSMGISVLYSRDLLSLEEKLITWSKQA